MSKAGNTYKIIILGAGLTGLTLAYLLSKRGESPILLEARNRIGGRILTVNANEGASIEMGATWIGKKHRLINQLLEELGIGIEVQKMGSHAIYEAAPETTAGLVPLPPNDEPSYRIAGGSENLIHTLAKEVGDDAIQLQTAVKRLELQKDAVQIHTNSSILESSIVISTLPPHLLVNSIAMEPELSANLIAVAQETHTWMGESIKVGIRYSAPFWEESPSKGTLFSNPGPITEMYDHSNYQKGVFALKGFLNSNYYSMTSEERQDKVIQQLKTYYGSPAEDLKGYEELVWRDEPFTSAPYQQPVYPHQHNGNIVFRSSLYNGKLFLAGSETATAFPGYMEGAVQSAYDVLERLPIG